MQAEAAQAAKLKGPHPFPMPRLLLIYRHLRRADDLELSAGQQKEPWAVPGSSGGSASAGTGAGAGALATLLPWMAGLAGAAQGAARRDARGGGGTLLDRDSAGLLMGVASLVSARLMTQVGLSVCVSEREF